MHVNIVAVKYSPGMSRAISGATRNVSRSSLISIRAAGSRKASSGRTRMKSCWPGFLTGMVRIAFLTPIPSAKSRLIRNFSGSNGFDVSVTSGLVVVATTVGPRRRNVGISSSSVAMGLSFSIATSRSVHKVGDGGGVGRDLMPGRHRLGDTLPANDLELRLRLDAELRGHLLATRLHDRHRGGLRRAHALDGAGERGDSRATASTGGAERVHCRRHRMAEVDQSGVHPRVAGRAAGVLLPGCRIEPPKLLTGWEEFSGLARDRLNDLAVLPALPECDGSQRDQLGAVGD